MAQTNDGIDMASIVSCESASCVSASPASLRVTANLGNGTYAVPAALAEFNLGGDCNEGGFRYNRVHWDLVLNGVIVRNSSQNIIGSPVDEVCYNGRFRIYIYLGPLAGIDPVDRTGLNTGSGGRANYNLYITIHGMDGPGAPGPTTPAMRQIIPLQAI